MHSFRAEIFIIGVNPYVFVPPKILENLFMDHGKDKGPIPVVVKINGNEFIQTLVKYSDKWRLYLNTPMRKSAGIDVGDFANVEIEFDVRDRTLEMHPKFAAALKRNKNAFAIFEKLIPSRKKEIIRYINNLKTEESREKISREQLVF